MYSSLDASSGHHQTHTSLHLHHVVTSGPQNGGRSSISDGTNILAKVSFKGTREWRMWRNPCPGSSLYAWQPSMLLVGAKGGSGPACRLHAPGPSLGFTAWPAPHTVTGHSKIDNPPHACRFKASRAKEIIGAVLKAKLAGQQYHADNTSSWAREIADDIKSKLKGALKPAACACAAACMLMSWCMHISNGSKGCSSVQCMQGRGGGHV